MSMPVCKLLFVLLCPLTLLFGLPSGFFSLNFYVSKCLFFLSIVMSTYSHFSHILFHLTADLFFRQTFSRFGFILFHYDSSSFSGLIIFLLDHFSRTIGDELGEAKASGNLGNTLKLLGRYDEAVVCCQRHLDITRAIYDKVGHGFVLFPLFFNRKVQLITKGPFY